MGKKKSSRRITVFWLYKAGLCGVIMCGCCTVWGTGGQWWFVPEKYVIALLCILWCWEKHKQSMLLRCYAVSLGHLINTYIWPPSKRWYPTCLLVGKAYKQRTCVSSATLLQDPRTSIETNIVIMQHLWLVITEYYKIESKCNSFCVLI